MSFIGVEGAYFGGPCDYLVDEDDVTSIAIRYGALFYLLLFC